MTRAEIERRLAAGGDPETLWECLYLTVPEVDEFLAFVKGRKAPAWFYPMLLFTAHTGARRSEMLRARVEDVDLGMCAATIREKKRGKGRLTTRRVPLSRSLAAELAPLIVPGRAYLFGDGVKPISVQAAQKAFPRAMRGSKWEVMNGYHVLRHSCASALAHKNIDQRVIDQIIGHSSAEMSRRYRPIRPDAAGDAVASVFG